VALIDGRATSEGTAGFRDRALAKHACAPAHFRSAPGGLHLASIGLGTYLGAPDPATDRAVEHAVTITTSSLRSNVIDTAINYRHQRAERSVGRALQRQIEAGGLERSEVFVATKVGHLSPDS
jgi:aryl-alcohol dehydrogenase-like predicted oxidoreductase